jgi:hypothetical protein
MLQVFAYVLAHVPSAMLEGTETEARLICEASP